MPKTYIVPAVGAFIFDSSNRIFLAKFREKFDRQWSIPGGKIEFGETPLEAVAREVREETNLDLRDYEFICHGAFTLNNTHVIYLDYMAECTDASGVVLNDEFTEWGFFSQAELENIPVIPKTKQTALEAMHLRSIRKLTTSR